MQWLFASFFAATGLLFIGISIPVILRRIPPNTNYGFRTKKTLENPDIWYKVNEYFGKLMALAGIAVVLTSVAFVFLRMPDSAYMATTGVVAVISASIAMIAGVMYLKTL